MLHQCHCRRFLVTSEGMQWKEYKGQVKALWLSDCHLLYVYSIPGTMGPDLADFGY